MLEINFEVNEEIIARRLLEDNRMPVDIANYLWDKYRMSYMALQRSFLAENIDKNLIEELCKQKFFRKIVQDSKNNMARIEKNWKENQLIINNFLKKILKLELNLQVTAYIVPPEYNQFIGSFKKGNKFIWGHWKGLEDKNYELVYLVHESLHSYFERGELTHAIIEKISDIELARFLNKTENHYAYHKENQEEHIKIYPFWNLYLNKTKEEIIKDQKFTKISYDIEKYERYREILSKLNIDEFLQFAKENENTINYQTYYEIE